MSDMLFDRFAVRNGAFTPKKLLSLAAAVAIVGGLGGAISVSDPAFAQPSYAQRSAAATEVRLQELEQEIRRLNGEIEKQNFEIRNLKAQLERITGDLAMRVGDLERGKSGALPGGNGGKFGTSEVMADNSAAAGAQTLVDSHSDPSSSFKYAPPQNGGSAGSNNGQQLGRISGDAASSLPISDQPLAAYEHAFSQLKKSNFKEAEIEFANFLKKYPDSNLASNAKYWYGETFYVRGKYDNAARIFAKAYQENPKGPKAADNLLKLGMSLAGMGNNSDACIALQQLEKEYAKTSSGPIIRRARQEMSRLGC